MIKRVITLIIIAVLVPMSLYAEPEMVSEASYTPMATGLGWLLAASFLYVIKEIKDRGIRR